MRASTFWWTTTIASSAYILCRENFFQGQGGYEINTYPWWLWQTARFTPNIDAVIVDEVQALASRVLAQ